MVLKNWKLAKFAASPAGTQTNMEEAVKRDIPDIYSMLRETRCHCGKGGVIEEEFLIKSAPRIFSSRNEQNIEAIYYSPRT
ncbi:hypothetical protein ACTXT7_015290 [Hymenolepis weldensis]